MRVPHSRADESMRQILRLRQTTHSVTRVTGESAKSAMGESVDNTTTVSIDAHLYRPNESNDALDFGERLSGDLQGLALPSADVQVNDQFEHDAETFQVEEIQHVPSNDDKALKRFSLTKMV